MQFYYDINLHFDDTYINYYLWNSSEHFNRLPIYKTENIRILLDNEITLDTEYKNILVTDGVLALALEILDSKVAYISSLAYQDEEKVNSLFFEDIATLDFTIIKPKELVYNSNINQRKKYLLRQIEEGDKPFLQYLYYELTGDVINNMQTMKKYLKEEINNNFSDKYLELYDKITLGE